MRKKKLMVACLWLMLAPLAQASAPDPTLSHKEIDKLVHSVADLLEAKYVHPEQGQKISQQLKSNLKKGQYKKLKDPMALSERIHQDIRSVVDDTHLMFEFNPEHAAHILAQSNEAGDPTARAAALKAMQQQNFGFQSVKILPGNLGYLKLDVFHDTEHAAETATAAMNFLSHTDAIIFDLRQNGGGSWKMIQLLSSYLFDPEPVHLSGSYWRPENKHTQNWTLPYVPGQRNPDAKVYVLTSANTHSAAEEFSYNLKHLQRATIIGETTMGGAHPGDFEVINEAFTLFVPYGRSTNPITQTNWEGVGVIPHIATKATDALVTAQVNALTQLAEENPGPEGDLYRWYLVSEKAKLNPVTLDATTLQSYAGTYGPRKLVVEGDRIYYQRGSGPKMALNALEADLFELAADNSFRMRIIKEGDKVTALQGLFDNGFKDQFSKE